jgi:hypothetical protein
MLYSKYNTHTSAKWGIEMQSIANKQLGRPVTIQGGSAVLAVRVPLAHQQAIAAEAKEKRWSVAEVVRVAVEAHIASNCKISD